MAETARQRYDKRHQALKQERSSWITHWRDISDHMLPRKGRWLHDEPNRGDKRNQNIINSAPVYALRTLSSGMMAGLTSPARPWFRLVTPDPDMMDFTPIRNWLYLVEVRMRDVFSKSNLYSALPTIYSELGGFGTAAMCAEEDFEDVVRFYPYTIGSYCLASSPRLVVDTFYHDTHLTVRQIVDMFGKQRDGTIDWTNISTSVRNLYETGATEKWIKILRVVEPNDERDARKIDNRSMAFRTAWLEAGGDSDKILRRSGYREFPIMAPRWDLTGEDVYGSSPGMTILGDCKQLQHDEKRYAQAVDKHVNPPLNAPGGMRGHPVNQLPGGVNFIDNWQQNGPSVAPLYTMKPELQALKLGMQDKEQAINRGMYADLFMMLALSDRRQMTATEVAERHEEKLLMLGPVLENLNRDLLKPLIDRTFAIMLRRGLLPPPPQELEGVDLKVEYISILAQAQRMVGISGADRFINTVTAAAQLNPDVLDKVNFDEVVDDYAEMLGNPPRWVRDDDTVKQIRDQRQQQQAMAQAAAMAQPMKDAAQAGKLMAEAQEPTR